LQKESGTPGWQRRSDEDERDAIKARREEIAAPGTRVKQMRQAAERNGERAVKETK
jgi:hypothetical protein